MVEIESIGGDGKSFIEEINAILDANAEARGFPFDTVPVNLRAADETGAFLGGLSGYGEQGWMYVRFLAVVPAARGLGIGRALLGRVEAIARERGLAGVYLDTYRFEAPDYYPRLGYAEIGRLPAIDGAMPRIWYCKTL
ncbi:MAG: GNAT family N-acetyltransferase, partial [Oricola sp.]